MHPHRVLPPLPGLTHDLAVLKAGEMTDTVRSSLEWILQQLVEGVGDPEATPRELLPVLVGTAPGRGTRAQRDRAARSLTEVVAAVSTCAGGSATAGAGVIRSDAT